MGVAGSIAEAYTSPLLKVLGTKPSKLLKIESSDDQVAALKDGTIDVMIAAQSLKNPKMVDLTASKPCRIIEIPPAMVDRINKEVFGGNPIFESSIIPAGIYTGIDKDVPAFGDRSAVSATSRMPDDVAYEITKIFWENQKDAIAMYKTIELSTLDLVKKTDYTGYGYHPGALKYYKEKGIK